MVEKAQEQSKPNIRANFQKKSVLLWLKRKSRQDVLRELRRRSKTHMSRK